MKPVTCISVALALALGVAGAAAQQPLETRDAWRIVAVGQDFALRTQALGASDTTFSLLCRKAQGAFEFEIKVRRLPPGRATRISASVSRSTATIRSG
jgi:hypothetical protein